MKNVFFLCALIIFCAAAAFPQITSDLEIEGLKGAVKTIESYEISFWGGETDRRQGKRNMSNITEYDRTGNVLERLSFSNDGGGASYEKYVHYYDSKGRKTSTVKYVSTKTRPGVTFEVERTTNWFYGLMLGLKESFASRTLYKFNENDRLIERTELDAAGNLIERRVFDYNKDGETTRLVIYNGRNELRVDNLTEYKKGEAVTESVKMENGVQANKFFRYFDEQGRTVKTVQFVFKPSPAFPNTTEAVIHNSTIYVFEGNKVKREWTSFDERGKPRWKNIIHDLNDDASLSESFEYKDAPGDDSSQTAGSFWRLTEREFSTYEYDEHGNWTKIIRFRQSDPSRPPVTTWIRERVISYY